MFRQIIKQASDSIPVPQQLRGHTIEVEFNDLDENETRPGKRIFQSVEEVHAYFSGPTIDTRGWKFNRDEANER